MTKQQCASHTGKIWMFCSVRAVALALTLLCGKVQCEDFAIAVLSDRQRTAGTNCGSGRCAVWDATIDYLVAQKEVQNIKGVFSVGDLCSSPNIEAEWTAVLNGSGTKGINALMAAGYMFGVSPGNHDTGSYWRTGGWFNYTNPLHFHPSYWDGRTWYKGNFEAGNGGNSYIQWTNSDGLKWMAIFLEFFPRESAIAWAKALVDAEPDRNTILFTHAYTMSDNAAPYENARRVQDTSPTGPNDYHIYTPGQPQYETCLLEGIVNACGTNGTHLWERLIKTSPNIVATFSGHFGGFGGYNLERNDAGNRVYQVSAIEAADDKVAYVILVTFRPDDRTIKIHHRDGLTGLDRPHSGFSTKTFTDWTPILPARESDGTLPVQIQP